MGCVGYSGDLTDLELVCAGTVFSPVRSASIGVRSLISALVV